jgi:type I restriction enzyme M protein
MDQTASATLVRTLRTQLNLSQEQLASRLGVSVATVNRWEAGKSKPQRAQQAAIEALAAETGNPAEVRSEDPVAYNATRRRRGLPKNSVLGNKPMEQMLWDAACSIRGEKDAPKFKDYLLPLLFAKRLSDVFDDEVRRLTDQFGDPDTALNILESDHSLVRFYLPPEARWPVVSGRQSFAWPEGKAPKTLGEHLTTAIRAIVKHNPTLAGVIDTVDFNESRNGEREISDAALKGVIETFSDPRYRLGLHDVEPDFLGRAYEYLLRKFAEGQGQSAGEFFTPKEVGWLIAHLVEPRQGENAYDPCCGSGGLLVKCELALLDREKTVSRPLHLFGQELTGSSFAIARMNMVIHDMEGEIVRGNTMTNPKFLDGSELRQFDLVVTNPMWNQSNFEPEQYESDPFERFAARGGFAPAGSADWAWR